MSLATGRRLGPYEILAPLGAGGMGEVYKARDTRLDRTVAIKVLPAHVAADPDLRRRFDREARAVAALNHQHICTLYDIGSQDGIDFLVMEHLEGETLADRLASGAGRLTPGSWLSASGKALPVDQALTIGIQVASALDRAHRAGITHRDLKPANIMLTKGGAKLLDFGLARTSAPVVAGMELSMLPTTPPNLTAQGTILGTFQYMAPEQLEGQEADARTDIFAFGAVLYEMLTGRKAFEGKSHASLIGAILKDNPPPISQALPLAPAMLDRIVTKCLAKDPDSRWQSASDLHDELQWVQQQPTHAVSPEPGRAAVKTPARLLWAAAVVAALLAGIGGTLTFRARPPEAPEMRLQIVTPDVTEQFALSPDGRSLVFAAGRRLWLRPLDSEAARPLAGTDGGDRPFWSGDSRSIGFFGDGKLKRLDVAGGSVQTLTAFPNSTLVGATWNADGVILLGRNPGPIERVFASGGVREAVTSVGAEQFSHRHPQFLPDGRHFLFFVTGTAAVRGVYVGSLDSKDTRRLIEADAAGVFVPPDHALFVRQETLFAQRLDLQRFEPVGEPFPVAAPIAFPAVSARTRADVSSSATGLLAYRTAPTRSSLLTWFDRAGREVGTVGGPDAAAAAPAGGGVVRLSSDGRYAALQRTVGGNADVWLVELLRNVSSRFTDDPSSDGGPVWSPDGGRIAFTSFRTGHNALYVGAVAGGLPNPLLSESADAENNQVYDWSPDSRFVLYNSLSEDTDFDLWVASVAADRQPFPVANTKASENQARFSPDSQWIAYQSNETGRNEIFVKRISGGGRGMQVSTDGGTNPKWPRDGGQILYSALDNRVMAVTVRLPAEGTDVQPGIPVRLFTLPSGSTFDVTQDGQRFLANVPTDEAVVPPITVVVNWRRAGK